MSIVLVGSTSGSVTLQEPAVAGTTVLTLPATSGNVVVDSATQTLTNKTIEGGTVISGTAVASTSGTSIDFTGIPSWVKRITVMFNGVSTSGSSGWILQIGAGSVDATSYTSHAIYTGVSTGGSSTTTGYVIVPALAGVGTNIYTGTNVLTNISSNTWVQSNAASLAQEAQLYAIIGAGSKTLSGTLDRIRITTINGTDTFDAGSINILYE
jgi:hypothetical protein